MPIMVTRDALLFGVKHKRDVNEVARLIFDKVTRLSRG